MFADLPLFLPVTTTAGRVLFDAARGMAMLVSQDCVLDKQKQGESTVLRLSFVPVRPLSELAAPQQPLVRAMRLEPFEVMPIEGEQFYYAVLSETFYLPASYFQAQLRAFDGELRLVATRNDTRVGCLTEEGRSLLSRKQAAFWGRLVAPDIDN